MQQKFLSFNSSSHHLYLSLILLKSDLFFTQELSCNYFWPQFCSVFEIEKISNSIKIIFLNIFLYTSRLKTQKFILFICLIIFCMEPNF